MTKSYSTLILLNQDGSGKTVLYSKTQLTVNTVLEGRIPKDFLDRVTGIADQQALANACGGEPFGAGGLVRGDQFQLLISRQGKSELKCLGFVAEAPVLIREFLNQLLTLPQYLKATGLADAYLWSETLTPERLANIRTAPQQRLINLTNTASDLQPILTKAINRPLEFVPLNRQQYEAIKALALPGRDFILSTGNSASQLTLFEPRPAQSSLRSDHETLTSSQIELGPKLALSFPPGSARGFHAPFDRSSR